jgi:hypothetical protein
MVFPAKTVSWQIFHRFYKAPLAYDRSPEATERLEGWKVGGTKFKQSTINSASLGQPGERARKLVHENSCDREGDCKGGRIVGGELPEAAERTHELIESKSEIEKGDSVPSVGVREVEES